ncbi:MAG: NAD(P)H-dependent oxidoreductase [Chloroflexi bacterium]|nr:NAD(P)H-dependent oxidoreductase [Chloroflexota bacterium]
MKITLLNGNPQPAAFDNYLAQLEASLTAGGHAVTRLDLREMTLRYCVGCWGCWVKTPGECVNRDASLDMDCTVINSDFVLWASPIKMGFPTELLKRAHDKHLPLIHPYMEVDQGEAHHLKRYARYPRVGLLLEKEADTDARDLQIVTDIHCRTALNFKTRLEFSLTTETPVEDLASRIISPAKASLPLPKRLTATSGVTVLPPRRLTLFNGSPRGRKGNTPVFLNQIAEGFGGGSEIHHLVRVRETEQMVQAFADAECVIFGFPLYTDSMPGVVKHFIEALEPLTGRATNPPIGFVVQSGFPEGLHSRYVERYLEKLADRLHSPYLGTVVKGNGEGVRIMPAEANQRLFTNLQAVGASLSKNGNFDTVVLTAISHPEQFPRILGPVFQLFVRLPIAHSYFDEMLKKNDAFEKRFARPFAE